MDEQVVFIGQSLYNALDSLRENEVDKTMWIDALCINQLDDDEKLVQIQQIDLIYSTAAKVISYLDEETESSTEDTAHTMPECSAMAKLPAHIFMHNYWTRLWIVQEIGLAQIIVVQIYGQKMPWETFLHSLPRWLQHTKGTQLYEACLEGEARIKAL